MGPTVHIPIRLQIDLELLLADEASATESVPAAVARALGRASRELARNGHGGPTVVHPPMIRWHGAEVPDEMRRRVEARIGSIIAQAVAAQRAAATLAGAHAQFPPARSAIQPGSQSGAAATAGAAPGRRPSLSRGGLDTFYLGTSENPRAAAMQIGIQPGEQRVTVTFAAMSPRLRNPPIGQRRMLLSIHHSAPRSPRIVRETEAETGRVGHQRIIEVQLGPDDTGPALLVDLRYARSRQWVPFPSGAQGVWRRVEVESLWIQATDGFHHMVINFPLEIAGSFLSARFRLWTHPGLGLGYQDTEDHYRFYPYPQGQPSDADLDIVRTFVHMTLVVGALVMLGETAVGRDIWGRRLTDTERVVLGAGVLLSVASPALRAGSTVAAGARAVQNLARVGGMSRLQALQLIRGARALTPVERTRLQTLAAKIRAGQALTQKEQTAIQRILGKLAEPARVASARAEVEALTGVAHRRGRFTDLAKDTSVEERRVGKTLARDLDADVVRIPEVKRQGVRTSDYVVDDVAAELYSPKTNDLENFVRGVAGKHGQAGVMVIDLTRTPLPNQTAIGAAPRIFGRPECADIGKLIYVDGDRIVRTVLRPASAAPASSAGPLIRGAASMLERSLDDTEDKK